MLVIIYDAKPPIIYIDSKGKAILNLLDAAAEMDSIVPYETPGAHLPFPEEGDNENDGDK
jgi:hypothetical protein